MARDGQLIALISWNSFIFSSYISWSAQSGRPTIFLTKISYDFSHLAVRTTCIIHLAFVDLIRIFFLNCESMQFSLFHLLLLPWPKIQNHFSDWSTRKSQMFALLGLLDLWRWDRYADPKDRYLSTNLRCATSQKSEDLIDNAAESCNQSCASQFTKVLCKFVTLILQVLNYFRFRPITQTSSIQLTQIYILRN